jgi:hypothetical protein
MAYPTYNRLRLTGLCAVMALTPLACTDDTTSSGELGTDGETECIPGQSVACTCNDGSSGAQICEPDSSGYGVCSCDGDSTAPGDGDPGDGDPGDGDPGDGDPGDGDPEEWDGVGAPSWSKHIVPFFYDSCGAGVDSCHSRQAYAAAVDSDCRGWLSLEDVALGSVYYAGDNAGNPTGCPDIALYERITTLAPWQCAPDSDYVTPGNLAQSYIWNKIQDQDLCELSPGMPSAPMPPPTSMIVLTDMQKQMIEAWILAGAPNDN